MNWKQVGLGIVLADFVALTAYAVYQHGYLGFFALVVANAATVTAFADLVIALTMVAIWMARDARERGVSVLPYLLLTLTLGSVGPLLYFIVRFASEPKRVVKATPEFSRA
jgi:hypothetical protein